MRILTRYILREITSHALIGAGVFTFVLFTRDLGRLLELVVRNSAPLPSVAEIFFFTVPVALIYTIPMGALVGILIGLSRLAADSEITAMRASGIGVWTFLRIVSIFAVAAWLLALVNSVYLAPRSQAALGRLQDRLKSSQASFEIQPRVFYEGFPQLVLYVQDVQSAQGAAIWKGVFIADISNPSAPRITLAQQGILVSQDMDTLHLHLSNGATHETDPKVPDQYQVSTFQQTDIPIQVPQNENKDEQAAVPVAQLGTGDLAVEAARVKKYQARWYWIEFHRRFALPTACLVLALVGIPLGLSSKKGGKSTGFVLTILLVFAYYSFSLIGVSLARQGRVSPGLGVWLANIAFLVAGAFLLWRAEHKPFDVAPLRNLWHPFKAGLNEGGGILIRPSPPEDAFKRATSRWRVFSARFPMILDDYVMRDFIAYLLMISATFLMLLLVFTLFELLGDILRNQVSPLVVGEYLLSVSPYFVYNITPLCVLLAVLITFGLMQRSNEITAIKATGISIYRIVVPVLIAASLLTAGLFFFDQFYLPHANKRQDALRNLIKGKPAQTYLNPERKWIFGQHSSIYYYQFFDSERDQFGNLSVFQFDPASFQLTHRVYAERAHWEDRLQRWICEQGWERNLRGPAIGNFRTFDVSTFPAINEPPLYFKKEVKQSSEMNYEELRRYIHDLQQSGFDVVRLKVQLQKKFAFPFIALVMAVLAIPFSLTHSKRGAVTGVAVAVGIAAVYTVVSNLFEAMGNVSQLPPILAAWAPDLIFGLTGGYLILKVPT
ncbi:MAG: LPS export ABC transporter permease LptF [Acidobacteria bacterium]|jgi:LPS export ABC transporter permease LptF/LPS export ABC transporter permease LptG|nr:MAG: LPS export ABC transporter permease LptF [Acidobacteriota bacterium]